MQAVLGFVIGILAVILAFGFIIFIHEMGHFLTARAVDIRCPQFAIGFGPVLFGFRWRGTNFAVRAFPFGGYVLMNGEEPREGEEDPWTEAVAGYLGEATFPATPQQLLTVLDKIPDSERTPEWHDVRDQVAYARATEFPNLKSVEGNFNDRSARARILVISGGVIMNFAATILILWCLAPLVGLGSFYSAWTPYISQAVAGSPAYQAGIRPGDLVLQVDGQPVTSNLAAYHAIGAHPAEPLELKILTRKKEEKTLLITPDLRLGNEVYSLDKDGHLLLKSSKDKTYDPPQRVVEPPREALIKSTEALVGTSDPAPSYSVTLSEQSKPISFSLPEDFTGPRGQVGVMFGVSDIRFENQFGGVVESVAPGSQAEKAGLKVGDHLVAIGGLALQANNGLVTYGSLANEALKALSDIEQVEDYALVVIRGDQAETAKIPKTAGETPTLSTLGVALAPISTGDKAAAPFALIKQTLFMPYFIVRAWLSREYSGKEIVENLQGPIGIMQLLFQISDNGLFQFFFFVALLNAAIGAFNLLPFPALDGSRLVFLVIAAVRGKALDPEKEAKIHLAGLMVLLSFVVLVSFGDVKRLISSHLFVL